MSRPSGLPIFLFAALLACSGCGRRESEVVQASRAGVLHLSSGAEPSDLDPQTVTSTNDGRIIHTLFDPLVSYAPDTLAPTPALAERWDVSADGLTYTFHLRRDARWSNGDPFVAEDVVASWRRILTPSLGAEYAYFLYVLRGAEAFHKTPQGDFSTVGVQARDPHTLAVTLAHPAPYFLQILLNSPWRPVHVRSIATHGDPLSRATRWTKPGALVGSGPFVLKEWSLNRRVVVEKSPTYYDRARVTLNAVHFYPIDNTDAEERAFRAGQIHGTWSLPLAKIEPLQRERSSVLRLDPLLETHFFRLNVRQPPLGDVRVRRALALAIDRDALVNRVLPGGRQPAASFVPPFLPGYNPPALRAFDPAAARESIAAAGFPGGRGFPELEITHHNAELLRLVAEAIQQMWKRELGISVRLTQQEKKTVFERRRAGDYQLVLGTWTADYLDATTFLDMWRADSGNNQTGWSDAAYDALCDRANTLLDPVARTRALAAAEKLLLEAAPIVPVYFNSRVYLLDPVVQGWHPTSMDHMDYRDVRLKPSP
jgi:oligopeptide transport system substrate-binding protein